LGLREGSSVADVGSGTGILSQLLLTQRGAVVYAVEPNREMREAAEALLQGEPNFRSVPGSAEATTLPDRSVDFVTAGQAFHWFDPALAREEFRRVLRPGGHVVLAWNERRLDSTPFLRDYERLLREFGTDYEAVAARYARDGEESERALRDFFGGDYQTARFDNHQELDFGGLKGRVMSASYAPLPGDERHEPMVRELRRIFLAHARKPDATTPPPDEPFADAIKRIIRHQPREGTVTIEYDTKVYYGQLR
jgi:SAM-dependent methyltransferase